MKFLTPPALLAAALASLIVVIPFLPEAKTHRAVLTFEARLMASAPGRVQIYYDTGAGYNEGQSTWLPLGRKDTLQRYALPLPGGSYRAIRFDPIDRDGTVTIESLRLLTAEGRELRKIAFGELHRAQQIATMREVGGRLEIVVEPGANDPQLTINFSPPLEAHTGTRELLNGLSRRALGVFAALVALLLGLDFALGARAAVRSLAQHFAARPRRAIALVAALAVVASAYPVIFLGKSYVSPNFGTSLLYDGFPTLPGSTAATAASSMGSDVGAIMWAHIPYSVVQHRALAEGELPLWNRYNSLGSPLLGQGQSMFGDPLHFFVILANGASWAWDLKFLVAKWGFALALGLLVLAVTRHTPSALLVALAAPFVGFFVYRINHPAFFSVCYAPWALYCWVRVTQAANARAAAWWAAGLIVANAALMNSGTAKEAYMLLLTMNFSGACGLLASDASWRERLAKLAGLAWAGVIFALLTAPVWATFLHTLANAQTAYDQPTAFQIQPALLLGLFDEIFYRPVMIQNFVFDPSLNFLLLFGVLYFLATLRTHFSNRLATALAASALVPLALVFGLVPAQWIVRVPFLANVAHIDNTFSCALVVLGAVLAGVGFAGAATRLGSREGRRDLVVAGLLLFALVFAWIAFRQTAHRSVFGPNLTFSVLQPGQVIPVSGFIWGYLVALLLASAGLAWAAERAMARRAFSPALVIVAGVCAIVMLWRQGLQPEASGFEEFVVRPPPRADFHAKSPTVDFLRAEQTRAPFRSFGFHGNFFPGWTGVYGLEAITSPDALMNPWYHELVTTRGAQHPWAWNLEVTPATVDSARVFFDPLNVRYYLDLPGDDAAVGRTLKLVHSADLNVYESPTAWPRAFFTDRLEVYDDAPGFVGLLRGGDGQPFAAAQRPQLGETRALLGIPRGLASRTVAPATNYRLTENTTSFDVHANGPGIVVLTETFWPGDFRAEVNGQKVPVLRMNHAFKAVLLDAAGDYHIAFRCVPKNFPRNLALCAVGALLLAGSLGLASWRGKI